MLTSSAMALSTSFDGMGDTSLSLSRPGGAVDVGVGCFRGTSDTGFPKRPRKSSSSCAGGGAGADLGFS